VGLGGEEHADVVGGGRERRGELGGGHSASARATGEAKSECASWQGSKYQE
jgi:hypothetical protein